MPFRLCPVGVKERKVEDMPRPSLRSRTIRRIKMKIPGGASVIHYLKREPSKARCANCKKVLHGVASTRPAGMKKLAKTKKVTSRAYGGNLCPGCTKELFKAKARNVRL
jgi:large subunit ribosomal protein L34e